MIYKGDKWVLPETLLKKRGEFGKLFLDNKPKYFGPHKSWVSYTPVDFTKRLQDTFVAEMEIFKETM